MQKSREQNVLSMFLFYVPFLCSSVQWVTVTRLQIRFAVYSQVTMTRFGCTVTRFGCSDPVRLHSDPVRLHSDPVQPGHCDSAY